MQHFFLMLLALTIASCSSRRSQPNLEVQKLDADLYAALRQAQERGTGAAQLAEKVSVIIHTEDVEALRRAGVQPVSINPRFVTATVSLAQIRKLVTLPEVKYIETGSRNLPQNKH